MKKPQFNLEKYFKKYSYNVNKIMGVDPVNFNNLYLLDNGILSNATKKEIKQEHIISTYLPNKNVIIYELKLQKNLLEKIELDDYIETKCYEEVGLDETEEYIFRHKMIDNLADEKNVVIEVVIISQSAFEEFFAPVKKDYGYLDYVSYPGFVFSVLYKENILVPQNDLFIYFTKDDIFITLYSEGKFLQTSIIPEGLENIYDELVESVKIKDFNFDVFMDLLVKKGLDLNNYSEKENILFNTLSEFFSNKFLIISNQLHSITRKFSLSTIDRIHMSTIKGVIPGISEFANMYLGVEANDLRFDLNYNPNNIEIDQILFLSMLYSQYSYKKDDQVDNFTIFYRPPTFFYRKSGQFLTISMASLLLSLVYPMYQNIDSYFVNKINIKQQQEVNKLNHIHNKLQHKNDKYNKVFKEKKKEKENLLKYKKNRDVIVDRIYKEKEGYIPKGILINQITKYLIENKVYVSEIKYGNSVVIVNSKKKRSSKTRENDSKDNKELVLDVYSSESKNITNFINELINKEHMIIATNGYIKTNNYYTSEILIKVEK